jgi:hypothetical protein
MDCADRKRRRAISQLFARWPVYLLPACGARPGCVQDSRHGRKTERVADLGEWHLTGWVGFSMSLDPTDTQLMLRDVGSDDIYALTLQEK